MILIYDVKLFYDRKDHKYVQSRFFVFILIKFNND